MKKLFILLLLLSTTDSFSSGIASNTNSAPCTNNTLETYSGNSNLSADWQPNEIKLRWYNNNTLMDVQASANTCTYDGTLTIPQTAPTRTGYTFAGWTVRPEMNFSTIPTNEDGTERWAIGVANNADYCMYDTDTGTAQNVPCNSNSTYNELQRYEWKVRFGHGDLYGMGGCSTDYGTFAQPGTPAIDNGVFCWCKATGYKMANTNIISVSVAVLSWIYPNYSSVVSQLSDCASFCSQHCALRVQTNSSFRTALFTPANN